MITTLTQLLQNPTMSGDKKLYSEWHVKQAWELQQSIIDGQKERIEAYEMALRDIIEHTLMGDSFYNNYHNLKQIAANALNQTKP